MQRAETISPVGHYHTKFIFQEPLAATTMRKTSIGCTFMVDSMAKVSLHLTTHITKLIVAEWNVQHTAVSVIASVHKVFGVHNLVHPRIDFFAQISSKVRGMNLNSPPYVIRRKIIALKWFSTCAIYNKERAAGTKRNLNEIENEKKKSYTEYDMES